MVGHRLRTPLNPNRRFMGRQPFPRILCSHDNDPHETWSPGILDQDTVVSLE